MKIRSDFVSNSSSCSFLVADVAAFAAKLRELCASADGVDTWWMNGLTLSFDVRGTPENKRAFADFIDQLYCWEDADGDVYASGDFSRIVDVDPSTYGEMKNVRVAAGESYESDCVNRLALLYMAMKASGVAVDDSGTERGFALFGDMPKGLVEAALAAYGKGKTA